MQFLKQDDFARLLLRVFVGVLMFFHGVSKIGNAGMLAMIKSGLAAKGLPEVVAYGVFLGEIVAPVLVIIGLYSRIGGLLIAGNMVFAVMLVHMGDIFSLSPHGGWALELQAFYFVTGLAILFLGSGKYAVKPD